MGISLINEKSRGTVHVKPLNVSERGREILLRVFISNGELSVVLVGLFVKLCFNKISLLF